MRKRGWFTALVFVFCVSGLAQEIPQGELSVTYSYLRFTGDGAGANFHGGSVSIAGNVNSWLGVVADFGGYTLTGGGSETPDYVPFRAASLLPQARKGDSVCPGSFWWGDHNRRRERLCHDRRGRGRCQGSRAGCYLSCSSRVLVDAFWEQHTKPCQGFGGHRLPLWPQVTIV